MFKLEQETYKKEKIMWDHISFEDNQETIDLIERRPISIFALLDEQGKLPNGNEVNYLSKIKKHLGKHPSLCKFG